MMSKRITRFAKDKSGITAIEYGLISLIVVVGIVASVTLLGDSVSSTYDDVAKSMPDQD